MVELKPTTPVDVASLPHERAKDYRMVYTNNAAFGFSQFDVGMTFSQVVPNPSGAPIIQDEVTITMAWEHLAALQEAITKIIEGFEANQKIKIRRGSTPMTGF